MFIRLPIRAIAVACSVLTFCIACNFSASRAFAETRPVSQPLNIVLICVDDLKPELNCYGKEYIQSPNIDRLAQRGCLFRRHYVQAPTCGASRYAMLTGCYGPTGNNSIFERAKLVNENPANVPPSLPGWLKEHGYETVSVGKVSHHPGGRGGADWDEVSILEMPNDWTKHLMPSGPWQHPRGAMHGLASGETRIKAGEMAVYQAEPGPDSIYPDGLIADTAIQELTRLAGQAEKTPFFLAVGFIRPHLPFGAPQQYFDLYEDTNLPPINNPEKPVGKTTWHGSGEFMRYNRWGRDPRNDSEFADLVRTHYAACVSYADAQLGRVLVELEESGLSDSTMVILWGDHGWHLGERGVWGKHTLFEESLHSPLIIHAPGVSSPGSSTNAIVETIDILPTICELASLPIPSEIDGTSLVPIIHNTRLDGDAALSYWGSKRNIYSIRTDGHRLIEHPNGECELYAYDNNQNGEVNLANQLPKVTAELRTLLKDRLKSVQ